MLIQRAFYAQSVFVCQMSIYHDHFDIRMAQNIIYLVDIIRIFRVPLKTQIQFADRISSIGRIIG